MWVIKEVEMDERDPRTGRDTVIWDERALLLLGVLMTQN